MLELCSIASGSSGNCICVGNDNTHILVDAGISGKRIEAGLNSFDLSTAEMQGVLITHEHSDHIQGLGVIARKYHLPIYATEGTIEAIKSISALGKIDPALFRVIGADQEFAIGDLRIMPKRISHDAADPVAYRFDHGKQAVAVVTDLGRYDDDLVQSMQNLDAILLEANHDVNMLQAGSYPYALKQRILGDRGHLSNENSGRFLCEILHDRLQSILLGHLSKENNYEQLAYEAVRLEITMGDNPFDAKDFHIRVAGRENPSERIVISANV